MPACWPPRRLSSTTGFPATDEALSELAEDVINQEAEEEEETA